MKSFFGRAFIILIILAGLPVFASAQNNPVVVIETNLGNIFIELFPVDAPITVDNFLAYANEGFYNNLLFHRSVQNGIFIIQAGAYYFNNNTFYQRQPNFPPIINESYNGLSNLRGTIAMARTSDPNSATSQFFINNENNTVLDRQNAANPGYCVFGKVVEGLDVVDAVANLNIIDAIPSNPYDPFGEFPYPPIVSIYSAYTMPCLLSYCADFNTDGKVNFEDFAMLTIRWLNDDCGSENNFCGSADLDYSGSVNYSDINIFIDNWLGRLGTEPLFSDFNDDGKINLKDMAVFAGHWLNDECNISNNFCGKADLNHNGSVNFQDFALFADNWLAVQ